MCKVISETRGKQMQTIIIIDNMYAENKNPYHIISQEKYLLYIASHYNRYLRHGGNHLVSDGVMGI